MCEINLKTIISRVGDLKLLEYTPCKVEGGEGAVIGKILSLKPLKM